MPDPRNCPKELLPPGASASRFDPQVLRAAAEAYNRRAYDTHMPVHAWTVLVLLDAWESIHGNYSQVPHDCHYDNRLESVAHAANASDWSGASNQGYEVRQCGICGDYWGCRYQYDPGTGADDRWHRFGSNIEDVKRHY